MTLPELSARATPRPAHKHIWGPRKGLARIIALGIARRWPELIQVCVMCGKEYRARAALAALAPEAVTERADPDRPVHVDYQQPERSAPAADGVPRTAAGRELVQQYVEWLRFWDPHTPGLIQKLDAEQVAAQIAQVEAEAAQPAPELDAPCAHCGSPEHIQRYARLPVKP